MVPKRVDSTNQNRLPANAHAHRAVFQARLPWQDMPGLHVDATIMRSACRLRMRACLLA